MLASYQGASFPHGLQADHSFPAENSYSPHQISQDGYHRVLQSTSENIRAPNYFGHGQVAFSKARQSRAEIQSVGTRRLVERLDLPGENEIIYEAVATRKVERDENKSEVRSSAKGPKETRQLHKSIPAAASNIDCRQNNGYYKYRMGAKKECCKKPWCKENNPHVLWPEEVEKSFQFWIRTILPMGKKKVYATVFNKKDSEFAKSCDLPPIKRKQCGRNELISYMIYLDTSVVRDRKQISSHIQVLRGHLKRANDDIFYKEEGKPAPHDECAVLYEKWGKLYWDEKLKRIVPGPDSPKKSDLRSSYLLTSNLSEYQPYRLPHTQPGMLDDSPPRFKEMQFCLYVTHKHDPNDSPLHTYTIAQQSTSAEARVIHDILDFHTFFPPAHRLSEDPSQDQLFYCEASLRMRHDLTEKGYQVGPDMKVMLSCPNDYRDWRVRASGYRGRGNELFKSEERHCESERGADGKVQIVLWASAVFWAQLLADCRLSYEGRQRPGDAFISPTANSLAEGAPAVRSEEVLDQASFVQEIFATRGRGEEVRVALLLWRFRQARDAEDVGLWTWRKIERNQEMLPQMPAMSMPYQHFPPGSAMILKSEDKEQGEDDTGDFSFNDLSMPIPTPKVSASNLASPRRSSAFDWGTITTGRDDPQHESTRYEQPPFMQEGTDIHERTGDQQMDIDTNTQAASFASQTSSAYSDTNRPSDPTMNSQESAFSFDFNNTQIEIPAEWETLDFSSIPGLETPAKQIEFQNFLSQQRNSRLSISTPSAFRTENLAFPIDPALSAWTTPASRVDGADGSNEATPTAKARPSIARALTYLEPVPETHILKSSNNEVGSSPDESATPTQQRYRKEALVDDQDTPQNKRQEVSDVADAGESQQTYSPLEPYEAPGRSDSHSPDKPSNDIDTQDEPAQDNDNVSTASQSFHSLHDEETQLQFDDQDSSFISQPSQAAGNEIVAVENFEDPESFISQAASQSQDAEVNIDMAASWQSLSSHHDQPMSQTQPQSMPQSHSQPKSQNHLHESFSQTSQPPSLPELPSQSQPQSHPQSQSQSQPHHVRLPSSDHDFEEICGNADQLAALSYSEVCDDGANLAQFAQLQAASLREAFALQYPSFQPSQQQQQQQHSRHGLQSSQSMPGFELQHAQGDAHGAGVQAMHGAHGGLGVRGSHPLNTHGHISRSNSRAGRSGGAVGVGAGSGAMGLVAQLSRANSRNGPRRYQQQQDRYRSRAPTPLMSTTLLPSQRSRSQYLSPSPSMSGLDALLTAAATEAGGHCQAQSRNQNQSQAHGLAPISHTHTHTPHLHTSTLHSSHPHSYSHAQSLHSSHPTHNHTSSNNTQEIKHPHTHSHPAFSHGPADPSHPSTSSSSGLGPGPVPSSSTGHEPARPRGPNNDHGLQLQSLRGSHEHEIHGDNGGRSAGPPDDHGLEPYQSHWNMMRASTGSEAIAFEMGDGSVGASALGRGMDIHGNDAGGGGSGVDGQLNGGGDGVGAVLGEVGVDGSFEMLDQS